MYCSKCGSNNKEDAKFCVYCGSELVANNNQQVMNNNPQQFVNNNPQQFVNNNPQAVMNNIPQQPVYNNAPRETNTNKTSNSGTASLIIGIVCLLLCVFLNFLIIPVAIVGIVLGAKAGKKGIAGIVLNILSILAVIVIIIAIAVFVFMEEFQTANYVSAYKCGSFSGNTSLSDFKENVDFELRADRTFKMEYNYDDGNGVIKGTYEVTETKHDETENTYTYILKLDATSRILNGKEVEGPYSTEYSLVLGENGEALLMNTISYNMYACEKVK